MLAGAGGNWGLDSDQKDMNTQHHQGDGPRGRLLPSFHLTGEERPGEAAEGKGPPQSRTAATSWGVTLGKHVNLTEPPFSRL